MAKEPQPDYVPAPQKRLREIMEERRRIEIGQRIKRFRGQMRQHQAAEKLNVSERTFQNWELGVSATDLDNYERMAKLFGVSVQDILGNENGEPQWATEIKAQLSRLETDLAELRESMAQLAIARALAPSDQAPGEDQPEAESN